MHYVLELYLEDLRRYINNATSGQSILVNGSVFVAVVASSFMRREVPEAQQRCRPRCEFAPAEILLVVRRIFARGGVMDP